MTAAHEQGETIKFPDTLLTPQPILPMAKVDLNIPFKTILKILGTALLVYLIIELFSLMMTLYLAIMLAVTLHPFLKYLARRQLPSYLGIAIITFGMVLCLFLLPSLILPPLIEQCTAMLSDLPRLRQSLQEHLPAMGPFQSLMTKTLQDFALPDPASLAAPLLTMSQIALGGILQLLLVLTFAIYLLSDGSRAVLWILAFFSDERKLKLQATADETSKVISAYVSGQVITSLICGAYTFVLLSILNVPSALMLAVMAAVFDILPVLGFFLATGPAILLALTVSPVTALLVLTFYLLYHAVENYFLVPKIYGKRLRLSDLVVLVSLLAAGSLGGIIGAIAVLPLVASYPIIERVWLVDILGRHVVKKHAQGQQQKQEAMASLGKFGPMPPSVRT